LCRNDLAARPSADHSFQCLGQLMSEDHELASLSCHGVSGGSGRDSLCL
jgi:hypothetical protein